QANIDRDAGLVGRIEVGGLVQSMRVTAECQGLRLQPSALHVQDVVDDDPVEPGPETAAPFERREPRDRLDQDFLRRVLGVLRMREHTDRDVVDPCLMTLHDLLEGRLFAGVGTGDKTGIDVFRRPLTKRRVFYHWVTSDLLDTRRYRV